MAAADAVFLDILMEGVEEDFAVRAFHAFCECDPFGGGVHYEMLEAIDNFEAEDDTAVFRGLNRLTHAIDGSSVRDPFVFTGHEFARPGAVIDSRHYCAAHVFHRSSKILKVR